MKSISVRSKPIIKSRESLTTTLELIGKKLYELRTALGYKSHEGFANDYDLPRVQYWRMEKGKSNLTLRSLDKLLAIYGLTITEFFSLIVNTEGGIARKGRTRSRLEELSKKQTNEEK